MCEKLEKKLRQSKTTIIYGVIAVLLFVLLFVASYCNRQKISSEANVRIVMLGDSILGSCRDESSVSSQLSVLLGEPVFNGALGGTSMGLLDNEGRLANTWDCLTMYSLSKAIVSGDFGPQQTVRSKEVATGYFEQTINELEQIDFGEVEILFINHALNDYHSGMQIYNEEDGYDPYTYTGALRSSIETLQRKYPDMRIILLTATYSCYPNNGVEELNCENYDLGGGVLEEYVNASVLLAEELGVEVIDLYHGLYPYKQWSDWLIYTTDGIHPNEAGRELIVTRIYEYLVTIQSHANFQ
uniref:SGNH/GDSL hydrolase family protein n=1 Tax=Acetatifactor sp. TaxID=1872090 RepID=UPI004056D633